MSTSRRMFPLQLTFGEPRLDGLTRCGIPDLFPDRTLFTLVALKPKG
jgi:hypothetical protein